MMPAFASSSLNLPISVSIFSSGIELASDSAVALTRTITRIVRFSLCHRRQRVQPAVHNPVDAVTIGEHAEALGPERRRPRHRHFGAVSEAVEYALRLLDVFVRHGERETFHPFMLRPHHRVATHQ